MDSFKWCFFLRCWCRKEKTLVISHSSTLSGRSTFSAFYENPSCPVPNYSRIFGLRTTFYLSENCFIEMHTGRKYRNYAFITAPEHVCNELIKLNDVTFQDMCLKVQEARQSDTRFNERKNITKSSFVRNVKSAADVYSPNRFEVLNCETTENDENDHPYHKDTSKVGSDTINHHSRYKQSKRPEVIVNRFPENQHTFQKKCTVPGEKTYKEAVTEKTNTTHTNHVAILGGSMISFNEGIKSEFNKTLRSGWARFKHFPGASSKDLLHYIDPTLEEQNFEAAIIHTGINDILYESSSRQINLLLQNIKEIGKKCKNYKVKYVFMSSLTFNTRVSRKLLNEVNEMIERVCLEDGYHYIENGNVYENDLFKDELHLQNSDKKNFVS